MFIKPWNVFELSNDSYSFSKKLFQNLINEIWIKFWVPSTWKTFHLKTFFETFNFEDVLVRKHLVWKRTTVARKLKKEPTIAHTPMPLLWTENNSQHWLYEEDVIYDCFQLSREYRTHWIHLWWTFFYAHLT